MIPAADIAIVGLGGAAGAIARFCVQQSAPLPLERIFHTAAINLAGCLLIGFAWALLNHFQAPAWINRLLIAGFLGGFTTFSAFALDTVTLMQTGRIAAAAGYVAASVAGGILLCAAAMSATSRLLSALH